MFFVGRTRETAQILKALSRGQNVVLMGKYGIGRTSLMRHVAEVGRERWRFVWVDFSETPASVCARLLAEMFPKPRHRRDRAHVGYRGARFKVCNLDLKDKRPHVLVLDNIARLSRPRLDLIRYLAREPRFQFVPITESFMPKDELFLLGAALYPVTTVCLGYLTASPSRELLRHHAQRRGLNWNETHLDSLVKASGGYPLGMKQLVMGRTLSHGHSERAGAPSVRAPRG